MTSIDNVQTIVDTATAAAGPSELEPGKIYAWLTPDGVVSQVDLTSDKYHDNPKRKIAKVYVEDIESFLTYWAKHNDAGSDLFVNVNSHYLTAVLDAHTTDGARWAEHKIVLELKTTDRWNAWANHDRKPLRQVVFAEFIEDHLDDIREPAAASMLEIAQTFQAATKVKFSSSITLGNGTRRLNWEETTDSRAGESGKLDVPAAFKIGIAPFDFAEQYEITARFRYRIDSGQLYITYLLDDPTAVIRDAVLDIVKQVEDKTKRKVMRGAPA